MTEPDDSPEQADANAALELAQLDVRVLPPPHLLRRDLAEGLARSYAAATEGRTVTRPEDTYDLQRRLARAHEVFTDYGRAYTYAAALVRGYQQQEMVAAVGETKTGSERPARNLTVPDRTGDVRLMVQYENARTYDLDQLIAAVATHTGSIQCEDPAEPGEPPSRTRTAELAIRAFLELGKFEPQARKVDAYAGNLARWGDDTLSAVVASAVTVDRAYVGIKHERKEAKR